jgi:ribosomal protein S18 acetylase RimI-like enzyme
MVDLRTDADGLEGSATAALALAAEANIAIALDVWARAADGGGARSGKGWLVAWAHAPLRSFNNVLPTRDDALLSDALAVAREHCPSGRFRVRAREGVAAIDDASASALGLERAGGIPSLALARISEAAIDLDARTFDVRGVGDDAALQAHVEVVADAFGWTPAELALVFTPPLREDPRWRGLVASIDGEPAGSSQLVIGDDGTAGIYFVGVRDRFRRLGLGEAMTSAALTAAREAGCVRASLQASPMGRPIYERMGFREVAYYRQYLPALPQS